MQRKFHSRTTKKLKDFAHERNVKPKSTVMEPHIPIHTLVKLVDAEDITNETVRTLHLSIEMNIVTSELESQNSSAEIYDTNLEVKFKQTSDSKKKSKPQFRNYCNFCYKSNHLVSNCFRKQRENGERKQKSFSRLKSTAKSFNQYFEAYKNQIHPNEQPSSYPINYYSRIKYDSRNRLISRYPFSPNRSFRFRSL